MVSEKRTKVQHGGSHTRRSIPEAASLEYAIEVLDCGTPSSGQVSSNELGQLKDWLNMAPKRTQRFIRVNAGSSKGRETYDDGTPIVVGSSDEGAASYRRPELASDPGKQGRHREIFTHRGMRNANHQSVPETYS